MPRTELDATSTRKEPVSASIQLQRTNGDKVELTVSNLEKWLAQAELSIHKKQEPSKKIELTSKNTLEFTLDMLGRFGLQSAEDVIAFFNSPAGETILALVEEELAEIAAIEYHVQQEQLTEQQHKHLLHVFLLLGLLHHHDAHARQMSNEEEAAAAEKKLHEKQKEAAMLEAALSLPGNENDYYAYTEAAQAIEDKLHQKHEASKQLEKDLAELAPQHQATEAKYNVFRNGLMALSEFVLGFEHHPNAPAVKEPSEELGSKINARIDHLIQKIDSNVKEIDRLLLANENEQARDLMHQNNANNLQVAALKEMLSVAQSNGEKMIYNDKFEAATSFDDAAYILSRGTHIEEKDGKRYLLKEGQTLVTASMEIKDEAEKQYKQLKPTQIMSVRQLVHHNHQLENAKYNSISAQSEQMQKDIIFLTDKLADMQTARAKAELSLRPTPTSTHSFQMKPVPAAKARPSLGIDDDFQQSYEHVIGLMSENPSPESIARLKELTARMNPSTAIKKQLGEIRPHMPILETTKKALLAQNNVGRVWRDPREPGIESQLEISSTPTPFSTKNRPRGA